MFIIRFFLFNKTISNIFHNFIPPKTITCNNRDPSWLNEEIRQKINNKNEIYKQYIRNRKL